MDIVGKFAPTSTGYLGLGKVTEAGNGIEVSTGPQIRFDGRCIDFLEFSEDDLVDLLRPVFRRLLAEAGIRMDAHGRVQTAVMAAATLELIKQLPTQVAEEIASCCDTMGGYPDCCAGGGYGQADPSTKPSGELKTVSHCCQAPLFKEGERLVCSGCRLGAKPIQVSSG
jgi:hypothetical protein